MKIFELEIHRLKYAKFFKEITHHLQEKDAKKGRIIFTPNPEICLKTLEDQEFLHMLQKAHYLTSDGIGLYLGYQINDFFEAHCHATSPHPNPLPKGEGASSILQPHFSLWEKIEGGLTKAVAFFLLPYYIFNILFRKQMLYKRYGSRICGSDITEDLVYFCEAKAIRIAILDPFFPHDLKKCEAQEHFSHNLKKVFPKLHFDHYVYSEKNADKIFEKIAHGKAKVLFSTLGMKRQEASILHGLKKCPNIRLGLAVGSSFDYFTGFQKRAPNIFRKTGFEWMYRIFTSPNKLKRLGRIYQAVIVFPLTVILYHK